MVLPKAIVTRGGRSDLADERVLYQVRAPTLFIVGCDDTPLIAMNKSSIEFLSNAEAKRACNDSWCSSSL